MKRKILSISISVLIILMIGYFYVREFRKNWAALQDFKLDVDFSYLAMSLLFCVLSYLMDTYVWKVSMNKHLTKHRLTFSESVAVVNTSGLFKYLPGRIWIYATQLAWLRKYGISKSKILHTNLLCIISSMTVSVYLGLFYTAIYSDKVDRYTVTLAFVALVVLNVLYIRYNTALLNKIIAIANRHFGKDIKPLVHSVSLLVSIQFVYACSWLVTGVSGYCLAKGVGLNVGTTEMFALLASMSLSWLVGYVAIVTPGGLGVREGFMLLMLNQVVNVQTALLFPILSRIMMSTAELLMGILAFVLGIRNKVFSYHPTDQRAQTGMPGSGDTDEGKSDLSRSAALRCKQTER